MLQSYGCEVFYPQTDTLGFPNKINFRFTRKRYVRTRFIDLILFGEEKIYTFYIQYGLFEWLLEKYYMSGMKVEVRGKPKMCDPLLFPHIKIVMLFNKKKTLQSYAVFHFSTSHYFDFDFTK